MVLPPGIFLNNQWFLSRRPTEYENHQSDIPLLVKSIFCQLFIIKSVVLALDTEYEYHQSGISLLKYVSKVLSPRL